MTKNFIKLNFIFCILSTLYISTLNAQVGIGTTSPKATLDVELPSNYELGQSAGISFPILTGDQIESIVTTDLKKGTLVYANLASTATVKDVKNVGYWFWTGDSILKWEPLNLPENKIISYFYAPSITLPITSQNVTTDTNADIYYIPNSETFVVNLYKIYEKQFGMAGNVNGSNRTAIKNSLANDLPISSSSNLDYYITYFDNKVFDPTSITLTNDGILTYKISSIVAATEETFMNIVFKVK